MLWQLLGHLLLIDIVPAHLHPEEASMQSNGVVFQVMISFQWFSAPHFGRF
jgi:hypothetical protein